MFWRVSPSKSVSTVFPILVVLVAFFRVADRIRLLPPTYLRDPDPSYAYLLNIANVAGLRQVGHVDHPGIGFDLVLAPFLRVFALARGDFSGLRARIVSDPEVYISSLLYAQLFLALISCLYFAVTIRDLKPAPATLVAGTVAAMVLGFNTFLTLTPETFVFSAGFFVAAYASKQVKSKAESTVVTLLVVLALWGKVVALPLVPLLALSLPKKHRKVAIGVAIATSAACLWFVRSRLHYMWNWFRSLAFSPGRHGSETTESYGQNLAKGYANLARSIGVPQSVLTLFIVSLAFTALIAAISIFKRSSFRDEEFSTIRVSSASALGLASALCFAIGFKNSFPRDFAAAPSLFALTLLLLLLPPPSDFPRTHVRRNRFASIVPRQAIAIMTAVVLISSVIDNRLYEPDVVRNRNEWVVERAEPVTEQKPLLYSYRARTPYGALLWADGYAGGAYSEALYTYGRKSDGGLAFEYNIWNDKIRFYNPESGSQWIGLPSYVRTNGHVTIIGASPRTIRSTPFGYGVEAGDWLSVAEVHTNSRGDTRGWTITPHVVHPIAYTKP